MKITVSDTALHVEVPWDEVGLIDLERNHSEGYTEWRIRHRGGSFELTGKGSALCFPSEGEQILDAFRKFQGLKS